MQAEGNKKWLVQVKGKIIRGEPYEISVIERGNELGRSSWGWGGLNKVVLFGNGLGQNPISPPTEKNIDFVFQVANALCAILNDEISSEVPEF